MITFSVLLKSVVQILLFLVATFVMVTRVCDNRHHTSDVVAGGLLGLLVALYMVSRPLSSSNDGVLGLCMTAVKFPQGMGSQPFWIPQGVRWFQNKCACQRQGCAASCYLLLQLGLRC